MSAPLPVIAPSPANTIACGLIFPIVSGAIVALRFYCRNLQGAKLLIDDWLTIPAWVSLLEITGDESCRSTNSTSVLYDWNGHLPCNRYDELNSQSDLPLTLHCTGVERHGFAYPSPQPGPGQNPKTFTAPEIVINRQLEWALELMQFPALTCIKLSFLFFYQRIFCTRVTKILNIFMWFLIVVCILWGIAFFFGFVFVCGTEITKLWGTNGDFKAHCSRILTENYYLTITDFILDAIIFIIPIPLVRRS